MSLRIVDDYKGPGFSRRLLRNLIFLFSILIILSGIGAAGVMFPIFFLTVHDTLFGDDPFRGEEVAVVLALTLYPVVALGFGRRALRGRRGLVLFLRRFGFVDSSSALTFAVGTAVGWRWRVVALDDAMLSSQGVRVSMRRTIRFGTWIGALGTLVIIISIFPEHFFVSDETIDMILDQLAESVVGSVVVSAFEWIWVTFVLEKIESVAQFFAIVILSILLVVVLIGLAMMCFIVLAILIWTTDRSVKRAERSKALRISEPLQIEPTVRHIGRGIDRFIAPRLTIVLAANDAWKATILAFSETASFVLIDVSDAGPNLLWEVKTLKEAIGDRWVLVGRRDRLEALARGDDRDETSRRLAQLLDGETALAYDLNNRRSMRRFARALGNKLDTLATLRS